MGNHDSWSSGNLSEVSHIAYKIAAPIGTTPKVQVH